MNIDTTKLRNVIYVGLDVHKESISLAAVEGKSVVAERRFGTRDLAKLHKFLQKLASKGLVRCCYEASGAGYALRRQILNWGFECEIAASSLIPTKPGERKKCDRLDAQKLAQYFQANLLTLIHIPTQEQEAARDLVRLRRALRKDVTRWKHRVVKFLATKGVAYHNGDNWTGIFRTWLTKIQLQQRLDQLTLAHKLDVLSVAEAKLKEIDREIETLSRTEPYQKPVQLLRGFKGVDTHTAMVIVTEIADIRRFSSPRKLMDYTGLTPAVHQSGKPDNNKASSITKAGNSNLRHVLIQAAWQYAKSPKRSRDLLKRKEELPAWLVQHSNKAQRRLYKRFHHLAANRDRKQAVVGTARELIGFLGAVLAEIA
ncbi:MAG: IS110 family transposase [Vulcanimicrobiota bacterium]